MSYRAISAIYPIFEQLAKKPIQGSFHPSLVKIHTIKKVRLDGRMNNENGWWPITIAQAR